ncbi:MAG TPA: phosphoglucosamine mutase [Bacteroidales bacterium]|nr:phosphoglucosamine mutase [Bacteroidales bacterium]HPT00984.1 phosphoglucosamine mutase [Bacteroidales bacterium]
MTLIKSISGIRGTIGGPQGNGLTPPDIVRFVAAYSVFIKRNNPGKRIRIIVGRDARTSGFMVNQLVTGTLMGMGIDVTDIGLSTTPTVEVAVIDKQAEGGIILTASHNPGHWNALKLLNDKGEFLNAADGAQVLEIADAGDFGFSEVMALGNYDTESTTIERHIQKVLALPLVDVEAIRKAGFSVVADCVNSTGGLAIPALLHALGVNTVHELYCTPDGHFPHNPEPLPENLVDLSETVVDKKASVGFAVDPDVDRLAIVCENGEMFGEEYTLVSVADYILKNTPGNTVSNLSSTRALRDVTEKYGGNYLASAVGEVNVVEKMKETGAVIGGEGNGGVIYPELHYGRDALVGIALFLTHLAKSGKKCSELRDAYPSYFISKNKITLEEGMDVDAIIRSIENKYEKQPKITVDGLKIEFDKEWVHLRKSNTEPIIRIYSESDSLAKADTLARKIMNDIGDIVTGR